jgi:hypothetical protein
MASIKLYAAAGFEPGDIIFFPLGVTLHLIVKEADALRNREVVIDPAQAHNSAPTETFRLIKPIGSGGAWYVRPMVGTGLYYASPRMMQNAQITQPVGLIPFEEALERTAEVNPISTGAPEGREPEEAAVCRKDDLYLKRKNPFRNNNEKPEGRALDNVRNAGRRADMFDDNDEHLEGWWIAPDGSTELLGSKQYHCDCTYIGKCPDEALRAGWVRVRRMAGYLGINAFSREHLLAVASAIEQLWRSVNPKLVILEIVHPYYGVALKGAALLRLLRTTDAAVWEHYNRPGVIFSSFDEAIEKASSSNAAPQDEVGQPKKVTPYYRPNASWFNEEPVGYNSDTGHGVREDLAPEDNDSYQRQFPMFTQSCSIRLQKSAGDDRLTFDEIKDKYSQLFHFLANYELHADQRDDEWRIVTEDDPSVGIYSEDVGPSFKSLEEMERWVIQYEPLIVKMLNDEPDWGTAQETLDNLTTIPLDIAIQESEQ